MTRDTQIAALLELIDRITRRNLQLDAALALALAERNLARKALRRHCEECGSQAQYGGESHLRLVMPTGARH